VWLCRPGLAHDPCTASFKTTVLGASGASSVTDASAARGSKFDCFYVYPTVSTETSDNSDLVVQPAETDVAIAQASRFSTVCRVWAPMYHQFTLAALESYERNPEGETAMMEHAEDVAYQSISSGFADYLAHDNDGRPIVFIGHSQGASMLVLLLQRLVEADPALHHRLVLAIVLGGNVVVPDGRQVGGSFSDIPACTAPGQPGCVIAYSSFPGQPPSTSLFGRPGQGVSLLAGQNATTGVHVVCTNPAALAGGRALLDPYFPTEGLLPTPWVEFPDLYQASCQSGEGATWLQVTKVTPASDTRPVVSESEGPNWGYHTYDVNLALGNLISDTAAAEAGWSRAAHTSG